MTPREKAIEAGSWAETLELGRLGPDVAGAVVEALEAAGLLIVDPVAGMDALLAAVFAADDGAVPATAGDPLPGTSGGGLVGPAPEQGDHPSRAQVFTDDELEELEDGPIDPILEALIDAHHGPHGQSDGKSFDLLEKAGRVTPDMIRTDRVYRTASGEGRKLHRPRRDGALVSTCGVSIKAEPGVDPAGVHWVHLCHGPHGCEAR